MIILETRDETVEGDYNLCLQEQPEDGYLTLSVDVCESHDHYASIDLNERDQRALLEYLTNKFGAQK